MRDSTVKWVNAESQLARKNLSHQKRDTEIPVNSEQPFRIRWFRLSVMQARVSWPSVIQKVGASLH